MLTAVTRLFAKLGVGGRPAIPLIEECLILDCVKGAENEKDFRAAIETIRGTQEIAD